MLARLEPRFDFYVTLHGVAIGEGNIFDRISSDYECIMVTGSPVGCRFEGGGNRPKQSEPLPNPWWYPQFKRTSGNPTVRPSARGGPALERVGSSQSRGCKCCFVYDQPRHPPHLGRPPPAPSSEGEPWRTSGVRASVVNPMVNIRQSKLQNVRLGGREEGNRIMHRVFALRESLMITLESSC
ncbi:Uncharacterized protein DBV15_06115 [Temnothorax longispinosus]|uniref:Uncharacterized protein n=1 Tax=Temnothorax longispinosus TaxID=300112 RepID=A0A4V3SA04_9HYME|nr:Uncharacterized protein DBV15_06115 [Temnothorax longispinosus]